METEIWVSIIASFTSLFVALISLFGSRRTSRAIEKLKFRLNSLSRKIEAIDEVIENIQKMKDDLQIMLNSPDDSYDASTAVEHLGIDRVHIFECYEKNMQYLEPKDVEIAHRAKNIALSVENSLKLKLKGLSYVSELSERDTSDILNIRNELTDLQNILRDSKTNSMFYKI